jgi:glycosyltransferase involved in cell wall biosynthesis
MPDLWPKKSPQTERTRSQLRSAAVSGFVEILRSVEDEGGVIITAQVWAMEVLADALATVSPQVRNRWRVIGQYHGSFAAAASGRDLGRLVRSYSKVSVMTALTEEDGAAFTQAGLNNVRSMPNPLAFWPETVVTGDGSVLTYLGRLSAEKGVDLLIDAWSLIADRHPGWQLRIVGDGPEKQALHDQARDLAGSDRIAWEPFTELAQDVLHSSDVVVLPSRTEGLPLVLAEAGACGVPVVATDCSSGVRTLVGEGGTLTMRGDSRDLAQALDRAMSDDTWRRSAGLRGREQMQAYRLDHIMSKWEDLIAEVSR